MAHDSEAIAAAALSISESILLCLVDLRILTNAEVLAVLEDAAAAHIAPGQSPEDAERGAAAAALIKAIAEGKNSVRRRN